ncbi:hypothetical protein HanPI659440_Chr13g0520301 [Helianthus annuus]|nr:hypothetical protein HanPI659440_Chr13g0520301 [Helianthus annuus]
MTGANESPRRNVQDQIASLLKILFLDEEVVNNSHPRKTVIPWTDVFQKSQSKEASTAPESSSREHETIDSPGPHESNDGDKPQTSELKYKEYICGEEAMRIAPTEPYCLRRPIRRGHLNISQYYPMQQVLSFFIPLAISIMKKNNHFCYFFGIVLSGCISV